MNSFLALSVTLLRWVTPLPKGRGKFKYFT